MANVLIFKINSPSKTRDHQKSISRRVNFIRQIAETPTRISDLRNVDWIMSALNEDGSGRLVGIVEPAEEKKNK